MAKIFSIFETFRAARKLAALLVWALLSSLTSAHAQSDDGTWSAGQFHFSDELGGFRIIGIRGAGTREDPIVLRQIFDSPFSATLVIRAAAGKVPDTHAEAAAPSRGALYLQMDIINNTNLAWIGFGFELQEKLDVPSTYGDGLSFDQLSRRSEDIFSNRFLNFEDEFEPGDRLVFNDGIVNNQTTVTMRFIITDFTPVPLFYLFQDPLIPAS